MKKNKYNSVATGELIYYIARKSGMNYTNTMQCKIVSYAINIGKLNIRSELLNKRVLNNQEQEEYNEYINITHDMVKNYSNSIMQLVKTVCEQYNYDYRLISSNLFDDSSIDINVKIIKVAESMSYFYLNKFIYSYGKYDSALQLVQVQSGITLDPSIIKILHDNKKEVKAILDNYL